MKNNSLLLFLLILALAGDIVLAYLLYDCMHQHDGELSETTSTPCTEVAIADKNVVLEGWDNFNTLNNTSNENWGVICRDAILKMFIDTSVNALSFYMCADNTDPSKTHSFSIGVVGCKVIQGSAPGSGEVITKENAEFYTCSPWCPPSCYVRSGR